MTEKVTLDLEKDLRNDLDGTYKKTLIDEFTQETFNIKKTLQKGVKPDEYKQLSLLVNAFEAASVVVEGVWREIHSTG
jgi:hypothetical protein